MRRRRKREGEKEGRKSMHCAAAKIACQVSGLMILVTSRNLLLCLVIGMHSFRSFFASVLTVTKNEARATAHTHARARV